MSDIGTTTTSFGEGKALSAELRAVTPEQIAATMARLEHIKNDSKDWITPSGCLTALPMPESGEVRIRMNHPSGDTGLFSIGPVAHEQFSEKLDIPMKYYRRLMGTAPGLLVNNLNYWFANQPENFMLRTLDGRIRATLSQRYRVLDSYDFAKAAFVAAKGANGNAVTQRLDLSETRFYMRMLSPDFGGKITGRGADLKAKGGKSYNFAPGYKRDDGTWQGPDSDDPQGDWCFPVAVFSNSDVGRGGLNVEIGALRATCDNLILVGTTLHKVHLGASLETGLRLTNETQDAKDKAFWLEVRDMVAAAFDEAQFKEMLATFNGAQAQVLDNPVEAVSAVVKYYGFSEDDEKSILSELISPSRGVNVGPTVWGLSNAVNVGPTVWGLSNAVNVLQHSVEAVDHSYDIARIGGDILANARELVKVRA